mgnify:CR=1 FL=1
MVVHHRFVLATVLAILGTQPGCASAEPPTCGEGTVERDGQCVVGGTAGEGSSAGDASGDEPSADDVADDGAADDVADDAADGSGGGMADTGTASGNDDGPAPGADPYGPCPGQSDFECSSDAHVYPDECRSELNGCSAGCGEDTDCAAPLGGTAVQRCELVSVPFSAQLCVLGCPGDLVCPDGMTCRPLDGENGPNDICVWP